MPRIAPRSPPAHGRATTSRPATAATLVLSEPITRLVFQRGAFDASDTALVATALFWFSFSLPFSGVNLLLTRTFFSLQRPWVPTALAFGNMVNWLPNHPS